MFQSDLFSVFFLVKNEAPFNSKSDQKINVLKREPQCHKTHAKRHLHTTSNTSVSSSSETLPATQRNIRFLDIYSGVSESRIDFVDAMVGLV